MQSFFKIWNFRRQCNIFKKMFGLSKLIWYSVFLQQNTYLRWYITFNLLLEFFIIQCISTYKQILFKIFPAASNKIILCVSENNVANLINSIHYCIIYHTRRLFYFTVKCVLKDTAINILETKITFLVQQSRFRQNVTHWLSLHR